MKMREGNIDAWIPITVSDKFGDEYHAKWFPLNMILRCLPPPKNLKSAPFHYENPARGYRTGTYLNALWVHIGLWCDTINGEPNMPKT